MIELRNLKKSYGDKAVLANLNLTLPDHGIIKLMGRSGTGKTTLLHIIAGLTEPDSGSVNITGSISMVFQEDRLLMSESALANAALAANGCTDRDPQKILSEMGLGEELKTKACDLSGGMARRVSIARALVRNADIYIMDEPLKGLDSRTAQNVCDVIRKYTAEKLLIIVSHSESEFADADRSICLEDINND